MFEPKTKVAVSFLLCMVFSSQALAAGELAQTFTLDGYFTAVGTTNPLLDSSVSVKVQILNPDKTCLLYEETQVLDTQASNGYFNIQVGSATGDAKRSGSDPGRTMTQIFQNSTAITAADAPSQTCTGLTYTPVANDLRYFRLIVTPSGTGVADTLSPDTVIDTVPMAMVAQSVQGLEKASILQVNVGTTMALSQANLESVFQSNAQVTELLALIAGTSSNFVQGTGAGFSPTAAVNFNGQSVTNSSGILLNGNSDRAVTVDRHSTANTAGNSLTVAGGGATTGATNKNGGDLVLSGGTATGTGSSGIEFKTSSPSSTGATDNTPTTKMVILGSGNVGIGTTSPVTRLDVIGPSASQLRLADNATNATSKLAYLTQRHYTNAEEDVSMLVGTSSAATTTLRLGGGSASLNAATELQFYTAPGNATLSGTQRMTIDGSGNVGIGTTVPNARLDILAGDTTALLVGADNGGSSRTNAVIKAGRIGTPHYLNGEEPVAAIFGFNQNSVSELRIGGGTTLLNAATDIQFYTAATTTTTSGTERMRITSSGNVGMGTTNPLLRLDVAGVSRFGNIGPSSPTTLSAGATTTDTSITVVSTSGYPDSGILYVTDTSTIEEAVSYTGKTATTFSGLTRALYGTTAKTWVSGATVDLVIQVVAGANDTVAPRVFYTQTRGMGYGRVPASWSGLGAQYSATLMTGTGMQISTANTGINWGTSSTKLVAQGTTAATDFVGVITNFNEKLRIDGSGNIGINNLAPRGRLEVNGIPNTRLTTSINSSVTTMQVAANTFPASGTLIIDSEQMFYTGGGTTTFTITRAANATTAASHNSSTPISFYGSSDFIVTSTGNVGIGTTVPSYKLQVAGGTIGLDNNQVVRFADTTNATPATLRMSAANNFQIYNGGSGHIQFTLANDIGVYQFNTGSSPTEKMMLSNSGSLGIGTNSPSQKLHVVGNMRVEGTVDCLIGTGSGATNCTSDIRLKDNVVPITDALSKITQIRGVAFDWNEKSRSPGKHSIGVIAQDVQKVFPTAVIENDRGYLSVDYAVLVSPLIEATKELKNRCDVTDVAVAQQGRALASLKGELSSLQQSHENLKRQNSQLAQELKALKQQEAMMKKDLESIKARLGL